MSLVEKLKKASLPFIFAGSLIPFNLLNSQSLNTSQRNFWDSEKPYVEKSEIGKEKKVALALITTWNPPKSSEEIGKMLRANFSQFPNYELITQKTRKIEDLEMYLKIHSRSKPIDALILALHGERYSIFANDYQSIDTTNVEKIFKKYSDSFSKDALIILYSCSTGFGKDNIAKRLSDVLDRDVIAPRYGLTPEVHLEPWQRIGEFALDENGRVSFDYKNFKKYFEIIWRAPSKSVATYSFKVFRGKLLLGENGKELFNFYDKNPE